TGYSNRNTVSKQYASTACAAATDAASPEAAGARWAAAEGDAARGASRGFTASTYQSASSFQTKSKHRLAASSSRNVSSEAVTSLIAPCARDRIQRSASCRRFWSKRSSGSTRSGSCARMNRPMFQSLFAKFRPGANVVSRSLGSRIRSDPSDRPAMAVQRSASAPNNRTTSSGSMPLPGDLDIWRGWGSRAVPVDGRERARAQEVIAGHDHARHPEEQDLGGRHQRVTRIEALQVGRPVGPAERREGPQPGREPGVEHVGVLLDRAAALGAGL